MNIIDPYVVIGLLNVAQVFTLSWCIVRIAQLILKRRRQP